MEMKNRKCNKRECENDAIYQLRLSLAVHENHEPAISTPIVYLCDDHKDDITFESFMSVPGNWEKICSGFTSNGRQAPKKEFSKLIIEHIK